MNARRTIIAWLASLAMAILLAPSIAGAEEMSYSALMSRIDALEQQLQQQHADFVSYEMGGAQKDNGDGKGNGKGKGGGERSLYAGYEATVLRPYLSSNYTPNGYDDEYGVGHRFIIGGENANGVGVRMRYWMYNHGHNFEPPVPGTANIDMDVFDLEATLSETLCNTDLLLSGGIRYGRAGLSYGIPEIYFEGTGPTVSLQASRDVGSRGVYLIGNLRASLLIGEIHQPNGLVVPGRDLADDEIMTVLESQLGAGWSREAMCGEFHVRALWETQFWMNDTWANPPGAPDGIGTNLALSGATFAVEYRR